MPSEYGGDGARFQKFAFDNLGEIDFIVAGPLSSNPFTEQQIEGRLTKLETVAEIITKKVYHRGGEAKARDIFNRCQFAIASRRNNCCARPDTQFIPEQL